MNTNPHPANVTRLPTSAKLARRAKWAFTTRRVDRERALSLCDRLAEAVPGDLLLGRVQQIGYQRRVQLAEGRPSELYLDDLVVLACGARYAPDQFEGLAQVDHELVDMLAAGGVAGTMRARNAKVSAPTRISPIGLLADGEGRVLNLADFAMPALPASVSGGLSVIAVVGASMNSGKTTATASLAHGLQRAGFEVAAIKATGTGAFGDYNCFVDAGARFVADFTDVGMVSTYQAPLARISSGLDTLLGAASRAGCEIALVEFADGVLQQETAALLASAEIRQRLAGVLFAAPDALSAVGGCAVLRGMGLDAFALTGTLSLSPLAAAEAEQATGLRVLSRESLCDPASASLLFASLVAPAGLTGEAAA